MSIISQKIPDIFFENVDVVYVGQFDIFRERQINAVFKDRAIYVTNEQDNEKDMIDDIVHEIAHAVEEQFRDFLYDDGEIKQEFLGKRKRLQQALSSEGIQTSNRSILNTEYSKEFDNFLYNDVGYEIISNLTMGLFLSPYSATSLREYFAIGFEEFFIGDQNYLKKISLQIFNKINNLIYL